VTDPPRAPSTDASDAGPPSRRSADVVVIGAGAVGAWCALCLARAGRSVLVVEERADAATRASYGNAGLITVSAAAPIAAPGVVAQGLRWSLQPRGPVRIRPRPSRRWMAWVWHFRRLCTAATVARTTRISVGLVRRSATLLDELARETQADFGFRRAGLVACFVTQEALEAATARLAVLRAAGIDARPLDAPGVRGRSPLAGAGVVGGIFFPEDAAVDPAAMTRATLARARSLGAEVASGVRVVGLRPGRGGRAVLETSDGSIDAEDVVVSAGFGSVAVLAGVGASPLIEPGKGYSDDLALRRPMHGPSLRLAEARVVATPLGDRLRVTSRLDLGVSSESTSQRVADRSLQAARRYLDPGRAGQRVRAPWTGLRPMTPDGLPLVGRHRRATNVVLATGHGHLGVAHAAATGELVVRTLAGEPVPVPELDPARFDPTPWRPAGPVVRRTPAAP
jgi:D-amino-acid dehydrogenase